MPLAADNPTLEIYRGDSFVKTFRFMTGDKDIPDALVLLDLRAYGDAWQGQLRRTEDADESTNFTVDTSQADSGIITVSLTPLQTRQLPSKGVWDLQVTDTSQTPNFIRTMLRGSFVRIKDVSRA